MRTFNQSPNFSIVTPGGCNAQCPFCFNKGKKYASQCSDSEFVSGLEKQLLNLDSRFMQISITGNEPMLSPVIWDVLDVCKRMRYRFPNVVLTTNGTNLTSNPYAVIDAVRHINISRHHYDDLQNRDIFGGTYAVTDTELDLLIDFYSRHGVDVSLSCVIDEYTTFEFVQRYINFAKRMGAHAVRFRRKYGTLQPTSIEERYRDVFGYPVLDHSECPVCREDRMVIRGQTVLWKCGLTEPIETIKDSIFELVYDTDGQTYLDWGRKKPLEEFMREHPDKKGCPCVDPSGSRCSINDYHPGGCGGGCSYSDLAVRPCGGGRSRC